MSVIVIHRVLAFLIDIMNTCDSMSFWSAIIASVVTGACTIVAALLGIKKPLEKTISAERFNKLITLYDSFLHTRKERLEIDERLIDCNVNVKISRYFEKLHLFSISFSYSKAYLSDELKKKIADYICFSDKLKERYHENRESDCFSVECFLKKNEELYNGIKNREKLIMESFEDRIKFLSK